MRKGKKVGHEQSIEHRQVLKNNGKNLKELDTHEHDYVISRTTGHPIEIGMGLHGGGLVPRNPFASIAQRGYLNANPEILGRTALDEWNQSSKGQHVPRKKRKK